MKMALETLISDQYFGSKQFFRLLISILTVIIIISGMNLLAWIFGAQTQWAKICTEKVEEKSDLLSGVF